MSQDARYKICAVCARTACGVGYSPDPKKPVIWLCDNLECLYDARNTYDMRANNLSQVERDCAVKTTFDVGQFLKKINKTDLNTFTAQEAQSLCLTIVEAYRKRLINAVDIVDASRSEAPF